MVRMSAAKLVVEDHRTLIGKGGQRLQVVTRNARATVQYQQWSTRPATYNPEPHSPSRDFNITLTR